jgi:ATP-dependent RNA helicase DDX51/DBP6
LKRHEEEEDGDESSSGNEELDSGVKAQKETPVKPPRKRQRLETQESVEKGGEVEEEEEMEVDEAFDVVKGGAESDEGEAEEAIASVPADEKSEIPEGTLPSFPLPVHPDAPSQSTLALQGLDKHIVDADIVHPSTTIPIPEGEGDDGGTRLSEKTRRRLKELGITELFAGKSSFEGPIWYTDARYQFKQP